MKTLLLSSLTKVFKDKEPNFKEFTSFSSLKNEKLSFQIAVCPETKSEEKLKFSVSSPLKKYIDCYVVKNIPSSLSRYEDSDEFFFEKGRTEYPDLLYPVSDTLTLKKGEWTSLWFEYVPKKDISGKKKITVTLEAGKNKVEKVFTLDIIDEKLPEQTLLFTNWFHNDCLCTYYKVDVFSDEYWRIVKNYIKNAVEHGLTMILTPVFTPPLDTEIGGERPTVQLVDIKKDGSKYTFGFKNFEKYVKICLECGIKAFEISHFFTQWGAKYAPKIVAEENGEIKRIFGWETEGTGEEYTEFLTQFAKEFDKEVKKLGIKKRCFLHTSDEPGMNDIENYEKAAKFLHSVFKGYRFFDALSDIEFYRSGLVDTPVPCENNADIFKNEVKKFWTYYCCGQTRTYLPNRMFAMPSQRTRILGTLLYKYEAEGFLQWGHNFWYSQYSIREIDPFTVTDAGGAFPSGDAFIVYPGEDGKPLNSLRHKVFYDGFCDMRALQLLEKLTSREYALKIIEQGVDTPLSFNSYPHEQGWLLDLRSRINDEIKNERKCNNG